MTQIKLRRDTSANFTSKNPILGNGEPAYETDTKKLKIGDGTTAYNSLAYFTMTDESAAYREKYGALSDSVPVVNTGNSITIKAGVSIETPNGTLTNTTDMTYTYDFLSDRVLFVTENDYYHAYAVYYGGKEPSPVGEQIFWFNNNAWTMISGDGAKTVFNTQKITPIAKIYQVDGVVKNIDYSSYSQISTGDAPSNMVTTDTAQTITGLKTFAGNIVLDQRQVESGIQCLYTNNTGNIQTSTFIQPQNFSLGAGYATLNIGLSDVRMILQGSTIKDGSGNKFLTSGNVTAGDGITITNTTNGVQIASTAVTPVRYPVEVSDKSLMPSWYVVYNDGWCEQGGKNNSGNSKAIVELLKAFANINYTASASLIGTDGAYLERADATLSTFTSSSFCIDFRNMGNNSVGTPVGYFWQASGYIR